MHFSPEQTAVMVGVVVSLVVGLAGVLATAGVVVKTWLEGLVQKMKLEQDARDEKAQQDREAMKKALDAQDVVLAATHQEVNSLRGTNLKTIQDMAQRIADENPQSKSDAIAAENTAADYQKHQENQAKVDAMPGTDAEKAGKKETPLFVVDPPIHLKSTES